MTESDPGVRAALAAEGTPLGAGSVHTVAHLHPFAYANLTREQWENAAEQAVEALAKHPDVPSPEAVKVALFTHDHMAMCLSAAGVADVHPTGQPFDAAAVVAYYRPPT